MRLCELDLERDRERLHRIWREVGWAEEGSTRNIELMVEHCPGFGGEVDGELEGAIFSVPGSMRYLDREVPFHGLAVMGIGFPARRRGLASRLFSERVIRNGEDGMAVTGLSMFDQGFYDRFGLGTLCYERRFWIDPKSLNVDSRPDPPERLGKQDWEAIAESRDRRRRVHGGVRFDIPEFTRAEMEWGEENFGLGYYNDDGELTHHIWFSIPGDRVRGPFAVRWMAWRDREQLMELLGLVRDLGDQINLVKLPEPPGLMLQMLLDRPFRNMQLTEGGEYENRIVTSAYQQFRILDVEKALAHTSIPGREPVRFNLELADPMEEYVGAERDWESCEGEYLVRVGEESEAEKGTAEPGLPTLSTSVNEFTRLWMGAHSASGLQLEGKLAAPTELITRLDRVFALPDPRPDWLF